MPTLLHVINDLATGGAQRVLLDQAAGLDRARWRVHVASLEVTPEGGLLAAFRAAGLRVHPLRGPREPLALAPLRLMGLVRRIAPELVHTHLAAADVCGRLAARAARVPHVITTFHNLSDWEEKLGHPLRRFERATLGLADRVVTVSDAVREAFLKVEPGFAPRTVTVRNGIPIEVFRARPGACATTREELGYAPDDFVVGAVARLDPRKGLDTLIDAFALAAAGRPAMRLLLVGDGPSGPELRLRARRTGLATRVRFAGDRADVPHLLAALDVFAAPSRTEALGVAILEALAAGVPAFGSDVGGIPELLSGGACGRLLPPGDPVAWAAALTDAAGDRAALARLAAAAPARARDFALERSVAALERVYDGLLGGPVALAEAA